MRQDAKGASCTCLVANLSLQHILGAGSDITHRRNPQLLQLLADVPSNSWQLIYLQNQQIRIHLSNARSLRMLPHITIRDGLIQMYPQDGIKPLWPHLIKWKHDAEEMLVWKGKPVPLSKHPADAACPVATYSLTLLLTSRGWILYCPLGLPFLVARRAISMLGPIPALAVQPVASKICCRMELTTSSGSPRPVTSR